MHTHVYKCVYKYIYVINSLSKMTNKHIVLCSVHIPRDIILFFCTEMYQTIKKIPNLHTIAILFIFFMVPADRKEAPQI